MSALIIFEAEVRSTLGKGGARATRRSGKVPGVLYGQSQEPIAIAIEPKLLIKELHQPGFFSKLLQVNVAGKPERAIARDVQFHPVTDEPLHIDFLRVGKDSLINVSVPVTFINDDKAPGIKKGGLLNIVVHSLEMKCPADHIPEALVIDLSGCEIGHSIHLDAVNLPKDAVPVHPERDHTIATIAAPNVSTKSAATEGEAA